MVLGENMPRPQVERLGAGGRQLSHIDRHVGARIRERRTMLGMTQRQLAELVGVSIQQMNKYERGDDRIAAGRLFIIAESLDVSISYLLRAWSKGSPGSRINSGALCSDLAAILCAFRAPSTRKPCARSHVYWRITTSAQSGSR